MADRKRPRRTRERIVENSLSLFNRDGAPHVTTADIAVEMGISPGNLYYHFRNKDEIAAELFKAFERRLEGLLTAPAGRPGNVEDLWFFLHVLFEAMWDYRFIYLRQDDAAGDGHGDTFVSKHGRRRRHARLRS
ncbi:MAG: TetR/AcrR family transcriptional regulator [Betaproteobacteria bacterium]|nr:MAG: TetR/AcrR family transcriptional regulator [Betaproteobacteria bacterium]